MKQEIKITPLVQRDFNEVSLNVIKAVVESNGQTLNNFIQGDKRPVFGKVYEIRHHKELEQAAKELGIGIIRGVPGFGTILFYDQQTKIFERLFIPLYIKAFPNL